MLISPNEWGKKKPEYLEYISSAKLLSDHTWEIVPEDFD
jgi:hypothetical protein